MTGIMTMVPSKLNSVVNRSLKKYIPQSELMEIKEKYRKMRRKNRKQKQYKMTGGAIDGTETTAVAPALAPSYSQENMNTILQTVVTAAVTAAIQQQQQQQAKSDASKSVSNDPLPKTGNDPAVADADADAAADTGTSADAADAADTGTSADAADAADTGTSPADAADAADTGTSPAATAATAKDGKKQPFSVGPEIKGDISIGVEIHECTNQNEVWKLVQFLIQKGLPYYIQLELKSGDKFLNKNDTNIFDLRRILYGKFTQNIKKIPSDKRGLYIEAKEVVGIANGDTFGVDQPGQFIYTGEKGQILKDSTDSNIQLRILQEDKNAAPSILTDSKRLYKIKGKDTDVKPASIDTMKFLQKLDSKNKIDTSEFRLQIAPMTPEELNKDAQNIAAGNDNPEVKVVVDESNTYVVNLDVGCKITSVQTLKKSLEKARASLESENDKDKMSALEIFKMLNALLQNPEFAKNDGYADFKESIYNFSYKIRGSERKYGMAQLRTFFDDKKDSLPLTLNKEFLKLLKLLGHGPNGSNGECERFEGTSLSAYELSRIQTFEEDGKIVTKKTETLDNASNMGGFMKQFSKLGQVGVEKEEAAPPAATAAPAAG
jgi:hypothetical protein